MNQWHIRIDSDAASAFDCIRQFWSAFHFYILWSGLACFRNRNTKNCSSSMVIEHEPNPKKHLPHHKYLETLQRECPFSNGISIVIYCFVAGLATVSSWYYLDTLPFVCKCLSEHRHNWTTVVSSLHFRWNIDGTLTLKERKKANSKEESVRVILNFFLVSPFPIVYSQP